MSVEGKTKASLLRSAVGGVAWMGLSRWSLRFANIVTLVVLARILSPTHFGLVAAAKIVSQFLVVGNFGLQSALVQRKEELNTHWLNVAWTYDRFLVNLILSISMFAVAPWVGWYFSEPGLVAVVRVLALFPVLEMCENCAVVGLSRELNFRRKFLMEASNGFAMGAVAIPLTLIWRNVWAFVVAFLVGRATRSVVSYFVYSHSPRLRFDTKVFRTLFIFGRWMIGLRFVTLLRQQADQLILGRLLGTERMGVFQIGSRFSTQIAIDVYQTTQRVMFPIYAQVQEQNERIERAYSAVLNVTMMVAAPVALTLSCLAEPVILTVLGPEWKPAILVLRVLALAGIVKTLTGTANPLFRGRGLPRYEFIQSLVFVSVLAPVLYYAATRWGLAGAVYAVVAAELALVPLWLYLVSRALSIRLTAIANGLWFPLLAALIMAAVELAVDGLVVSTAPLVRVLVSGTTGLAVYVFCVYLGWRWFNWHGLDFLIDRLKRRKKRAD